MIGMLGNPVVLALAAALCLSLGLVLAQFGLTRLAPSQGALVSVPTSTAVLWLLSPAVMDWQGFAPDGAAVFALVGLMFPASVTLLTFEANRRMGPTVAGAFGNLTPLFALLLAAPLFGEYPGVVQGLGIATILVGVAALTIDRRWLAQSWPWWAVFIPLATAAIRGVAQPVTKLGLGLWPSPFAAVLLGYSVSSLVILAAGLVRAGGLPASFPPSGIAWFAAGCHIPVVHPGPDRAAAAPGAHRRPTLCRRRADRCRRRHLDREWVMRRVGMESRRCFALWSPTGGSA